MRPWGYSLVVEHLPGMCEVLGSIPSIGGKITLYVAITTIYEQNFSIVACMAVHTIPCARETEAETVGKGAFVKSDRQQPEFGSRAPKWRED